MWILQKKFCVETKFGQKTTIMNKTFGILIQKTQFI